MKHPAKGPLRHPHEAQSGAPHHLGGRLTILNDSLLRTPHTTMLRAFQLTLTVGFVILMIADIATARAGLSSGVWVAATGLTYASLAVIPWNPYVACALLWTGASLDAGPDHVTLTVAAAAITILTAFIRSSIYFAAAHGLLMLAWALLHTFPLGVFQPDLQIWEGVVPLLSAHTLSLFIRHLLLSRENTVKQLEALQKTYARTRLDERNALARELHDSVAHDLILIRMQAISYHQSDDVHDAQQALRTINTASFSAITELRAIFTTLRRPGERTLGAPVDACRKPRNLEVGCRQICMSLTQLGFKVDASVNGIDHALITPQIAHSCIRILQESVTNIIKHAKPRSGCRISIFSNRGHLTIRVSSTLDTQPRQVTNTEPMGLRNMQTRAAAAGGTFTTTSTEKRWIVYATIPLQQAQPAITPGNQLSASVRPDHIRMLE